MDAPKPVPASDESEEPRLRKREVMLPWLNDGQPVKLGNIPTAGDIRLEAMRAEYKHIVAMDTAAYFTHLRASLLTAKMALDEEGAEEAHKMWKISFGSFFENLDWDAETFSETLDEALVEYVYNPLGILVKEDGSEYDMSKASDCKLRFQAGMAAVQREKKEQARQIQTFRDQRKDFLHDLHLEEVFWLLWRATPRPEWMPPFSVIAECDESELETVIAKAKRHISFFLDDEGDDNDYTAIMAATRSGSRFVDLGMLKDTMDEEAVAKKASSTSKISAKQ